MVHRHVEVVDFRGINLFSVLREIAYFYLNFEKYFLLVSLQVVAAQHGEAAGVPQKVEFPYNKNRLLTYVWRKTHFLSKIPFKRLVQLVLA